MDLQEQKDIYFNGRERMNPELENILKSNSTELAENPAFPKTDINGNPINFLELIAYKRFNDVVKNVKRFTNLQNVTGQNGMGQLTSMLMQSFSSVVQMEKPHIEELENLAVDLVVKEMEIPDDVFQFNCKIVRQGEINQDGFQNETKNPQEDEVENQFGEEAQAENMTPAEFFELEKHKRRFVNLLIQGSSKKGHYMFELVRDKINKINPQLANNYGIMMSINDIIYWLLSDETIKSMASQPQNMGGKEEIEVGNDSESESENENETGLPTIKTEAVCFPIAVHEVIKGIMEVFGTKGLPDDPKSSEMIIDGVDSLSNETMDLRLGVVIWEKFREQLPQLVFEEGKKHLQHYLFSRFCALDTTEFFKVAKQIMSNDPKGAKYLQRMTDEIISDLNVKQFEGNQDDNNEDDINIDDIFNYKTGGKVKTIKESDIQVGQKFNLIDGEIIEINRLFIENYDENWVEYSREGEIYENSVNNLKNFINNWRADKKESGGMAGLSEVSGMLPNPLPMSTIQPMAYGGKIYGKKIYNLILPRGFYVRINPSYTATIRNLNDFENYLKRKDEVFGKQFGEITNTDKSASKEWVDELNYLIAQKKAELKNEAIIKYEVGDSITIFRNQGDREAYVIARIDNEILVEYTMPNGTSALNIIDTSLPEYDENNYKKNYIPISYDNVRISKKWSSKIDANGLINNPQGSAKRFNDGGGLGALIPINESKAEKWYFRLKESDRRYLSNKYPQNNNETNEDWFQKVWIESGKSIGIKRKKFADGGNIYNIKSDFNKLKDVDIRLKLIPNDGSEEDGDENDLPLKYIGDIYTGGLDLDEPFVELGFQLIPNNNYDDIAEFTLSSENNDIKSDLNKYKNVDIRLKLIPNDGSEEDGDENDLSLNYVGEIYHNDYMQLVELGFQVNNEYADGGMVNKIIGIAKTHPYSTDTETYAYPTNEKVPSKFFNQLGITLKNEDDFVLVVEIQFDTKEIILQGYYGSDGENYDDVYSYHINQLSVEFEKWLVSSLLQEIKRIKDLIRLKKIDGLIKELEKKSGKTKKECQEIIEKFKQIEETKFADGGEIVWVDNFELDQDKINRAKYIINYNRGNYTIIDNKTKKAITSFPTQISAVNYINTELNKFANGGKINSKNNYDVYDNKRMLLNQANEIEHHSEELNEQVKITKQVPAWVIAKMERATTDLSDITHYLDGENKMADGGSVDAKRYDVVPSGDKFIVVRVYSKAGSYSAKNGVIIRDFNGNPLKFDDVNTAKNFINNIEPKYPYGIPKANAGLILLASQLLQQKQQQQPQPQPQPQPQIVYYVPKPVEEPINEISERNQDITQDVPLMAFGGDIDEDYMPHSDFCITNLLHLANDIQKIKYYVTHKFDKKDFEYENYKGRLIIIFDEPASINVVSSITKFIERAEDCHHIFEQSTNVSGSNPNQVSINLLIDKFTNIEFGLGGKVYQFAPKKINLNKTKNIKTNDGEFVLSLISEDFVYFVNSEEGDENSNTIMYNKKGELLSDNYFASNDLFETLENQSNFEFIHPDLKTFKENEERKNKFKK